MFFITWMVRSGFMFRAHKHTTPSCSEKVIANLYISNNSELTSETPAINLALTLYNVYYTNSIKNISNLYGLTILEKNIIF